MDFHSFFLKSGNTIACAESCTGGNIAHQITVNAGSSQYFLGSVVAYANSAKENLLQVSAQNIHQYGAVSELVAREMALGAKTQFHSDYAVSTTGIAGPTGGLALKPVGLVWMAVAGKNGVVAKEFRFVGNREGIISQATEQAIDFLVEQIKLGV